MHFHKDMDNLTSDQIETLEALHNETEERLNKELENMSDAEWAKMCKIDENNLTK